MRRDLPVWVNWFASFPAGPAGERLSAIVSRQDRHRRADSWLSSPVAAPALLPQPPHAASTGQSKPGEKSAPAGRENAGRRCIGALESSAILYETEVSLPRL